MHIWTPVKKLPVEMASLTARRMAEAAVALLASLTPEQEEQVLYPVDSSERLNWDYRPRQRSGLSLSRMEPHQKQRAGALMAAGLSRRGNIQALNIMALEKILGVLEGAAGHHNRNPEFYYVTIFGEPSVERPWGWRIEGHHLSLNFFVVEGRHVAPTPSFFGANPAKVPEGPMSGFRTLPEEEDLARHLLTSLDEKQRRQAVFSPDAPDDIVTRWYPSIRNMEEPVGIPLEEMTEEDQKPLMMDLIREYLTRMPPDVADLRMNAIEKEGLKYIHFAWAGSGEPGQPHYYRLHGPGFLVEYDNTQNNANHIHTVWRDLQDDWGEDLLRRHYAQSHHNR